MTGRAVRTSGLPSRKCLTAQDVGLSGNLLQVRRVHTRAIPAEVIELQRRVDLPNEPAEGDTVRLLWMPSDLEHAIAASVAAAYPDPALALYSDFLEEPRLV